MDNGSFFLIDNVPDVNCITFKTKEGKWYYGTEGGDAGGQQARLY